MNTFKNDQYTITTSLSDHSIYIKITNNVSYETYEGTFEKNAFRLSFDLAGIFGLVNKCFATFTDGQTESHYVVRFELESARLLLSFCCALEGIFRIDFELRLSEKIVSGDSVVSLELEKQRQMIEMLTERLEKQNQLVETLQAKIEKQTNEFKKLHAIYDKKQTDMSAELSKLVKKVDKLELIEINYDVTVTSYNDYLCFPINVIKLIINPDGCFQDYFRDDNRYYEHHDLLKKVKYLYRLEELTIVGWVGEFAKLYLSNATVKDLGIACSNNTHDAVSYIKRFPSLVVLRTLACVNLTPLITILRSSKIKKLILGGTININTTEMQTYCTQNGIELILD